MRVRELAEWLGATFEGDGEKELTGVAPLETAGGSELSFLGGRKAMQQADSSAAGCLIVPPGLSQPQPPHGDSRAGAAHGLRARHEPLLSDDGDQAGHPSHGGDRQRCGDRRAGGHRAARQHRRQHAHRRGQQHRPRLLDRQARGAGRRLRAARQRHHLRQCGHRTRRDPALRLRDRRGRLRLRFRERPLSQVPAGGPRGDRRLRGDRREFLRGPRRAGRHA